VSARKRPTEVAPVDLYDAHCQRVAREAEGWIAARGRGAWVAEMARRRAWQNVADLARLADLTPAAPVLALGDRAGRQCSGCGHIFRSTVHDVCERCHVDRERVAVADGLFGGAS
jgi:hypothetical protein